MRAKETEDMRSSVFLPYKHWKMDRIVTGMSLTTIICTNLHCMTIMEAATDTAGSINKWRFNVKMFK
jgi:hypothetical protein